MLVEALLTLTAETTPALRDRGLVDDAVALWSRAYRQRRSWVPHEEQCHAVVRDAIAGLCQRRTVVVLGSGLLRDVPFPYLVHSFERVILVDAVHLWPARRQSKHPKVERRIVDLTGNAEHRASVRATRPDELVQLKGDPSVDLVISANVLSQLPLGAEERIEQGEDTAADIVRRHLADIGDFAGRVCLLTDTAYFDRDRSGADGPDQDLLGGVRLPPPDRSWEWEVAPRGEIDRSFARIHRAGGWSDFRR